MDKQTKLNENIVHQSFNRYSRLMITNSTKVVIIGTATPFYEGPLIITNENYKKIRQSRFFYLSNSRTYNVLDQVFETNEFVEQYCEYVRYFKNTRGLMDSEYIEKLNFKFIELFKKYNIAFWDVDNEFVAKNGHSDRDILVTKPDASFLNDLRSDIILVSNMKKGGNSWNKLTELLIENNLEHKFERDYWGIASMQAFTNDELIAQLKRILKII